MSNNSKRELRPRSNAIDYRLLNSVGRTEGGAAAAEVIVESVDQAPSSDSESFFSGCESPGHSSSSCHDLDNTAVTVTESEEVKCASDNSRKMTNPRITQLAAELETIFFQLEENSDTVRDELLDMQLKDCNELYEEIKELRITMVKYNRELMLLNTDNDTRFDFADKVSKLCLSSKENMRVIKTRITGFENLKEQGEREREDD